MKKLVAVLTLTMSMFVGSIALASNGSMLDMEEEFVTMFWDRGNYKMFEPLISDQMKPEFPEAAYKEFRKEVGDKCGKMTYKKFRIFQKLDDADVVQYEVKFSKDKKPYIFEFAFDVSTGKPMLANFELVTLEEAPANGAAPAAK